MNHLLRFVLVALGMLLVAFAEEEAKAIDLSEPECNKIDYGDHVLFTYHTKYENGTAGPQVKETHQPLYFKMPATEEDMEGQFQIYSDLFGKCSNSSYTIHYDNLVDADIRPIIDYGSDIYELEETFEMNFKIQFVTSKEDYQIFEALRSANISLVLDLIDNHIGINAMDEYGQTPLMIAVARQYLPVVAALLNTRRPKVDVNLAKTSGFTALFYAVESSTPSILQALLRRGADPNMSVLQSGSKGNTPLHFACMLEKPKHAQLLLEFGANPYAKNEHGMIPYKLVPRDAVPSARLQYKTMFQEVYKKLAAQEANNKGKGEL